MKTRLLACLVAAGTAANAAPRPTDAVYKLTLENAILSRTPLVVYMDCRDGVMKHAFGEGLNVVSHDVDASRLKLEGTALTGPLKVTVNPDNWVPKGYRQLHYTYGIRASINGTRVEGAYTVVSTDDGVADKPKLKTVEEKVPPELLKALKKRPDAPKPETGPKPRTLSGEITARPSRPEPAEIRIALERIQGPAYKGWGNRGTLRFVVAGNEVVSSIIGAPNNTTYAEWTCFIKKAVATLTPDSLEATFDTKVNGKGPGAGNLHVALSGRIIGDKVAGRFTSKLDEKQLVEAPFIGSVKHSPAPHAADATYAVQLWGAAAGKKEVWLHLASRDGRFGRGLAFAPQFNHAVHDVDAAGLKLAGGRLKGNIEMTVNPDPYIPPDKKPIDCAYTIDADVKNGGVSGSFSGTWGSEKVAGPVTGQLTQPVKHSTNFSFHWKMEEGMTGGSAWHNRTYASMTIVNGKAVTGGASNNKGGWKGTFDGGEAKLDGNRLKAKANVTVTSGSVKKGTYTFEIEAIIVGAHLIGDHSSILNGKVVKRGKIMGGIRFEAQE